MSNESKRITVAISGHWLVGDLSLAGIRIQEAINDSRTDFLKLFDVEVHPLANRDCTIHLSEVAIPKTNIQIVAVPTSEHEAPEKRWNNLASKEAFRAFAIANEFRILGDLHLPGKPKGLEVLLTQQLRQFFALTDAVYSLGEDHLSVPLLLVNKDFVSCFHVGEPAQAEMADVAERAGSARPA